MLGSLIGDATAKQYLFSMSSDNSVVEMIDIENDFANFAWKTTNFFSMSNPINSYQYSLFEIGDTNNYIAVFIYSKVLFNLRDSRLELALSIKAIIEFLPKDF